MAKEFIHLLHSHFESLLDDETKKRIEQIAQSQGNAFGVDPYGFDPKTLLAIAPLLCWFYRHYFRVETFGADNVPSGRMMVIANHSGQLPFDGAMIITAFLLEPAVPRLLRGMVERWSAEVPFVSTLFARVGQVIGSPSTCESLLERGEGVIVFPEGVKGISKLFSERYKLTNFGTGFMRIALAAHAPIVPVAVIGAEEQAPAVANLTPLAKSLGLPAFPIIFPQLFPIPLPVKYRIYIGEPLYFSGDGTEDDDEINELVQKTKSTIEKMIEKGLDERKHIFF
ncbi:MAG TPA: lysophospholipid acyltransferase family protein [Myxococcota bacterium]|nr:lysophospholipid acyltransferase family protein [Myxococcota bacterium]